MSSSRNARRGGGFRRTGGAGSSSGSTREPFTRGGCERHPSHLKGRNIGLFYARKNRERREREGDTEQETRSLGTIILSTSKKDQIQSIINSSSFKQIFASDGGSFDHIKDSAFKRDFLKVIQESIEEKLARTPATIVNRDVNLDRKLLELQVAKLAHPKYAEMLPKRQKLPSFSMKAQILDMVNKNQICVISGETGCGKTTQVAQFILDDQIQRGSGSTCRVVCTQPRRISAITVAERVAAERAEKLGNSVGYHIRLERRFPRERGSICFCTTGVILKIMESDPSLSTVSHLILDEIHERDVLSDFILALLKQVTVRRPDLKIILMSATLNSEKFSKYFDNAPHLNIPGFTFPVQEFYLEDVLQRTNFTFGETRFERDSNGVARKEFVRDFLEPHLRQLEAEGKYSRNVLIQLRSPSSEILSMDLILALLIDICQKEKDDGAILVFVTGFMEISSLSKLISASTFFTPHKYRVFPLHSQMPTVDQRQIFERPAAGVRKIILATNIAETSITIEDVVFVIDCGKIKISNFNVETNTETLYPEWVSLANASQRKGRAGRVQPGQCFHLYSRAREMTMEQYQKPEILRKRLEDVVLLAKILQLGLVEPFFASLIDSPDPQSVTLSLNLLKQLNALTDEEALTPLGYQMAKLPIAPQLAKMILMGALFNCLNPILSVAVTLDFKDAFQLALGKEKEADARRKELAQGMQSDHLLYHKVLTMYEDLSDNYGRTRDFCWRNFLSSFTLKQLKDMKGQFAEYLCEMNFLSNFDPHCPTANANSHNTSLVKAIICAGLYPNISFVHRPGKFPAFTVDGKKIAVHPKSVLYQEKYFHANILAYYRRLRSTSDFVHDASIIHPLPVIFFGDHFAQITDSRGKNMIIVNNNKLKFQCSQSTGNLIKDLRNRFNWFLEYKISHPGPVDWTSDNDEKKILEVIMELITCEDMQDYDGDAFDDTD